MAWIRVPLLVGLVLLWFLGTSGNALSVMGDCFGPPSECDPYSDRMGQVFAFGTGLLIANTAAALAALVWRSRPIALASWLLRPLRQSSGPCPSSLRAPGRTQSVLASFCSCQERSF